MGKITLSGSPAQFGKLIADETEKLAKVMKFGAVARRGTAHHDFSF
jgi:hypothetical protein